MEVTSTALPILGATPTANCRTDHVRLPFPIKGDVLELHNKNPFIFAGDPPVEQVPKLLELGAVS